MDKDKLIIEEQEILDQLIDEMDGELKNIDAALAKILIKRRIDREMTVPESYALLIQDNEAIKGLSEAKQNVYTSRDSLYEHRIEVDFKDIKDESGMKLSSGTLDMKIGLHSYIKQGKIFVYNWKMPICRHYLLDNSAINYTNTTKDAKGYEFVTDYKLRLKRKLELYFDEVVKVTQLYPYVPDARTYDKPKPPNPPTSGALSVPEEEETDELIRQMYYDELLDELAKRRGEKEFQNIIFSIQINQGKIIQAPVDENMIVQGCAGSGKSMIMLHRLPILIYDNPDFINKNYLYIITPSTSYIEMAEQMRRDLEISDIEMGTINQYYDYCIETKYGRDKKEYGKIDLKNKVTMEQERYIYSSDFVKFIRNEMQNSLNLVCKNFENEARIFNVTMNANNQRQDTFRDILNQYVLFTGKIYGANAANLRSYFDSIRPAYKEIINLHNMLSTRKEAIIRSLRRKIDAENQIITDTNKELLKLDSETNKIAYDRRVEIIKGSENNIHLYQETLKKVEEDTEFFKKLEVLRYRAKVIIDLYFDKFDENFERNDIYKISKIIDERFGIYRALNEIISDLMSVEDPYNSYVEEFSMQTKKNERTAKEMAASKFDLIPLEKFVEIKEANEQSSDYLKDLPRIVYKKCLEQFGYKVDDKGAIKGNQHSPFMYAMILFQYQGAPNVAKENLITIDEAQNIAPSEIYLIRKINDDKVILNLFGDEKQHVEGTKGLDKWSDLDRIFKYNKYEMNENYRNAEQITKYCNTKFGLNMRPINLPGNGYHEIHTYIDLIKECGHIFSQAMKSVISAIIVKDEAEARFFMNKFQQYSLKFNDMTGNDSKISLNKWNILTVTQSKGLEFETVIALSGNMTNNEQYIAYTRALDEIYIYDEFIPEGELETYSKNETFATKEEKTKIERSSSRQRGSNRPTGIQDYSNSEITKFFVSKGLTIKDLRKNGGYFWVIGEKDIIDPVIEDAKKTLGISGQYARAAKSIGFKNGWFTNSKK